MALSINPSISPNIPVNATAKADTKPVSAKIAPDNEIDQIENSPNAKKLYTAKLIGGSIGAAVPLSVALVSILKARTNWKAGNVMKLILQAGIAVAALSLTTEAAKIGAAVSNALTIFFSTRTKNISE